MSEYRDRYINIKKKVTEKSSTIVTFIKSFVVYPFSWFVLVFTIVYIIPNYIKVENQRHLKIQWFVVPLIIAVIAVSAAHIWHYISLTYYPEKIASKKKRLSKKEKPSLAEDEYEVECANDFVDYVNTLHVSDQFKHSEIAYSKRSNAEELKRVSPDAESPYTIEQLNKYGTLITGVGEWTVYMSRRHPEIEGISYVDEWARDLMNDIQDEIQVFEEWEEEKKKIYKTLTSGKTGEEKVKDEIIKQCYDLSDIRIYSDINLKAGDDKVSENDILIITKTGIYPLEVKNYSGVVDITEDGKIYANGQLMGDLASQVRSHDIAIQNILKNVIGKKFIHPVVVMANDETVVNNYSSLKVLRPYEVRNFMINKSSKEITNDKFVEIVTEIMRNVQPPKEFMFKDIRYGTLDMLFNEIYEFVSYFAKLKPYYSMTEDENWNGGDYLYMDESDTDKIFIGTTRLLDRKYGCSNYQELCETTHSK